MNKNALYITCAYHYLIDGIGKMELQQPETYEFINGRQVLKKHVATIHCSNKLSLLERKISNALLFHAFPNLQSQLVHEITIEQLKRLLGANTRNHKALKDALKTLISTVIEWNLLGDNIPEMELEGWNASTILSSVSVKKGVIKYQYSELIKTLIIDPAIYGKINLVIQSRFKSAYALALYENCSRYRGLAYTKNIDILIFRKLMGVEDGKYEVFRDFNRRVLNPAVTEINTCSDIRVTPEIFRRGRKVQSIQFKIEERPIKQRIGIQATASKLEKDLNKTQTAVSFEGVSEDIIAALIKAYGRARVDKAIEYVKSRPAYQQGKINNIAGYLKTAVVNQYEETKQKSMPKTILTTEQQQTIDWRLHKHEYLRYVTPQLIQGFSQLSEQSQQLLLTQLREQGHAVLGGNAQTLIEVYYHLLGETDDRLQQAIKNNDCHVITFFENGFSEFVLKVNDHLKSSVCSFESYMDLKQEIVN